MFYTGFDAFFSILFPLVFLVVLGMILFTVVSNLRTWGKNNASPRLTVPATVDERFPPSYGQYDVAYVHYLLCHLSGRKR